MGSSEAPVIISGAGPVGLIAAANLIRHGIPVVVLERSEDVPRDLRASTFHPPTLDMLAEFGIADRLVERGLVCRNWQYRDRDTGVVATFDMGVLSDDTAYPFRLQCEQWKMSDMLREDFARTGGIDMRYGHSVTGFTQDEDGVTVLFTDPAGESGEVRGRYLIAADGAHSPIRKQLGVKFDGQTIPEIFLSISTSFDFAAVIPDLAPIAYVSDPDEWQVLLRTPTLWRVLLPTDARLSDDEIKNPDTIERRLQAIQFNPDRYEILHCTAYRVHERVAEAYVHGRVFLAGDAAHLNNPLGGMGMNGGIHDALNLTNRLVEVLAGAAPETLGRYERQRRKVALDTVQATTLRNRKMMSEKDPAARAAYHDELRGIVADRAKHRAHLLKASMIQSLRDLEAVA